MELVTPFTPLLADLCTVREPADLMFNVLSDRYGPTDTKLAGRPVPLLEGVLDRTLRAMYSGALRSVMGGHTLDQGEGQVGLWPSQAPPSHSGTVFAFEDALQSEAERECMEEVMAMDGALRRTAPGASPCVCSPHAFGVRAEGSPMRMRLLAFLDGLAAAIAVTDARTLPGVARVAAPDWALALASRPEQAAAARQMCHTLLLQLLRRGLAPPFDAMYCPGTDTHRAKVRVSALCAVIVRCVRPLCVVCIACVVCVVRCVRCMRFMRYARARSDPPPLVRPHPSCACGRPSLCWSEWSPRRCSPRWRTVCGPACFRTRRATYGS